MKLATLKNIYVELNRDIFKGLLTQPIILAKRWRGSVGQFYVNSHGVSYMEFNPCGIVGISHARSIVYHEMVHQFVSEYLDCDDDDHHGTIFWAWYVRLATGDIELGEYL